MYYEIYSSQSIVNLGIAKIRNLDLLCCVTSDVNGMSFSSRYPNTAAPLKRDTEEDFDDDEDEEAGALVIKEEGPAETGYNSPETSPTTCK